MEEIENEIGNSSTLLSKEQETKLFEAFLEDFENSFIDLIDAVVEIDGFCVVSLESIRKIKVALNRPKDWEGIKLIDKFINSRTE
jgi:hypothetical protein